MSKEADNFITKISKEWTDKGLLIEGGWKVLEYVWLQGVSDVQRAEMRKAYFFGAQHLFASCLNIMDPGQEVTGADLKRMCLIHEELEAFTRSFKQDVISRSQSNQRNN